MAVIMGFVGKRGDGKTLAMTAALFRAHTFERTIFSNYGLHFPDESTANPSYIPLTADMVSDFAKSDSGLIDAAIGIDEIHVWLDSRMHGSKRNRVASYMLTQTRKRSVDVFYTTQFLHQVEKRVRDNTDIIVECRNRNREKDMGKPPEECNPDLILTIIDKGREKIYQRHIPPVRAKKIAEWYNTNEVIAMAEAD